MRSGLDAVAGLALDLVGAVVDALVRLACEATGTRPGADREGSAPGEDATGLVESERAGALSERGRS
jgi:hypothetical protein